MEHALLGYKLYVYDAAVQHRGVDTGAKQIAYDCAIVPIVALFCEYATGNVDQTMVVSAWCTIRWVISAL